MTEEEQAADKRWQKRVSARVLGGKIKDFKLWLETPNGQLTLVGIFVVVMMLAGALEQVTQ